MSEEINVNETNESFAEMLEQSIKTLHTGEKVTGVVTRVTPTEVHVDLGTKQAGYIPASELSDDSSVSPSDVVKVGDEIEVFVVRVNDVEGMIMLSKKKIDTLKVWETVEKAQDDRTILEGRVAEENKGGIVVSVKGVRVFVPASQTGVPKDMPLSDLVGTTVRLRITEFNRQRRRVVGSIRSVLSDERRAAAEAVWTEIEPGKEYKGVVKSLTSYGAFVDIGGVDGMVHISELSWGRIKHPSDVLKVGDLVEVYVISVDKEKKKISLGYKKAEDNPWLAFESQFKKGDIIKVKIVKFMPFGAFAEIIPGVDGLIHISQISTRRISRPAEVLQMGQEADVVITDIDYENKKISLSIRALLENTAPVESDEPAAEPEDGESGEDAPSAE